MTSKSLNLIQTATKPAGRLGLFKFYSENNSYLYYFLVITISISTFLKFLKHSFIGMLKHKPNKEYVMSIAEKNMLLSAFSKKTPKQVFIHYYNKLGKTLNQ